MRHTTQQEKIAPVTETLESERIVVSSPMSFHGSAVRIWRLTDGAHEGWLHVALSAVAVALIALAWSVIACWYIFWLIVCWPLFFAWRIFRRGNRNRRAEAARHRETLAALERHED